MSEIQFIQIVHVMLHIGLRDAKSIADVVWTVHAGGVVDNKLFGHELISGFRLAGAIARMPCFTDK